MYAIDGGDPSETSSVTVTVNIEDVNDNAPIFPDSASKVISLHENTTGNTLIATIMFNDNDKVGTDNAKLTYEITGGSGSALFTIGPSDGELRTASDAKFDHENTTLYNLTIEASDGGDPVMTGSVSFNVNILNIDDSNPTFLLSIYNFNINETQPIGTSVGTVEAIDEDPFQKMYVYSIDLIKTNEAAASNFSVHNETGVITSQTVFDRETDNEQFRLFINVQYVNEPTPTDQTEVVITVIDVDEEGPMVVQFNDITLVENNALDVLVGIAIAEDSDPDSVLVYTLTSPDSVLKINSSTGEIYTAKVIDRETLSNPQNCPANTQTNISCYTISIIVLDVTTNKYDFGDNAVLYIGDIDDTPPSFEASSYSISINENLMIGTELTSLNIVATDSDLGIILEYTIEDNADFSIHSRSAIVSIKQKLDFETVKNYNLTLTATDSQNNQGTSLLYITIEDYNDNNPQFSQDVYTSVIPEGVSVSVFVAKVNATDIDSEGINSDIDFSIIDGDENNFFTIDMKTGTVTVSKEGIDRETTPYFNLTILAQDNGSPSLNSTAQLDITVSDKHDEKPVFTQSAFYGYVTEGASNGSPVYANGTNDVPLLVSATDPDLNAVVTITKSGSDPFNVNESTGAVTVSGDIDYETQMSYKFTCEAMDNVGDNADSVDVFITVINIDDTLPNFEQDSYSVNVNEETVIGGDVVLVKANDDDVGDIVKYRLSEANSVFAINSSTGQVTLKTLLDFESQITHEFTVEASSNNFADFSSVMVTVTVLNIDDSPPVFVEEEYNACIDENKQGVSILTVKANDVDTDNVMYELLSGDISYFTIGSSDGVIRAADNADIDYESFTSLMIEVLAFNVGNNLSNTTTVIICINDVNDETPTYSNDSYTYSVSETLVKDDIVAEQVAIDKDTELQFNTITYSITFVTPDNGAFAINENTGVIYVSVNKLPTAAQVSQYTLIVQASDGTNTGSANFYFNIVDVNMAPVFSQISYSSTLNEGYNLNDVFLTVEATEETDLGVNAIIIYSISLLDGYVENKTDCEAEVMIIENDESGSGSGDNNTNTETEIVLKEAIEDCRVFPFVINSATGGIYLRTDLDYETNSTWMFTVTATDNGSIPQSATVPVTVTVTDDNDEEPYFTEIDYTIKIAEDLEVGQLVTAIVKANDPDTVSEGKLSYYILDGAEGTFKIDVTNGDITLDKSLVLKDYLLSIRVTDGLFNVDTFLTVSVLDVNNNSPVFSEPSYEGSFDEEQPLGTSVLKVTATDEDLGMNGDVYYKILTVTNSFQINQTSGWIYTNESFDFEVQPNEHVLTVQAYDDGLISNTANVTVTLTELDINDETPMFDELEYYVELPEGTYDKYYLLTITATDLDSGENKEIEFILGNDDAEDFYLDETTPGAVFVTGTFDFDDVLEEDRLFVLNVTVEDNGDESLNSTTMLTINITDANDNAPIFDPVLQSVLIPENTTVNDTAFTVEATDRDSGNNGRLTYTIKSYSHDTCKTYYINPSTGQVSLTAPVDAESNVFNMECTLIIEAVDNGSPQLSAQVTYDVTITDINEHPPVLNSSKYATVPENSPAGYEFYTIVTSDIDPNDLSYEAIEGDVLLFTATEDGTLAVLADNSLDYDEPPINYNLTVLITENGKPAMSTTVTIYITVTDENDKTPQFTKDEFVTSVRENNVVGHIITYVLATDLDKSPHNVVQYSIIENADAETDYGKFTIDSSDGAVKIAALLDYETEQRNYTLLIQATDGLNVATVTLKIRVLESNDNQPEFVNLPNETSIDEDADNGTYVFTVSAMDKDFGVNAKITYSLDASENRFVIDSNTGVITVGIKPDNDGFNYESGETSVIVSVTATDRAGTEGSGAAQDSSGFGIEPLTHINDTTLQVTNELLVNINDVNDESPMFSPIDTVLIVEHENNNIFVTQVSAVDNDKPNTNNSIVRYLIQSGHDNKFQINTKTGVITSIPPIDKEAQDIYNLEVVAHDLGEPQQSSTVTVTVEILDIGDEAPQFTQSLYSKAVEENLPENEEVFTVRATDLDGNGTSIVYYTLIDTTNYFEIDNLTGIISTTDLPIDRETYPNITLTVIAEDEEGFTDTATVELTIIDENDNPPQFDSDTYVIDLTENAAIDTVLTDVSAVDPDSSNNAITRYVWEQISGHQDRFQLDPNNGNIKIIKRLCFDSTDQETYKFTVTAYDFNKPTLNKSSDLTILVQEENLHAPDFERPSYVSRLDSEAEAGTIVIEEFITTDDDLCSGPPIFAIQDGNVNNTFEIDPATGKITLTRGLTLTDLSFTLTINATDTSNFNVKSIVGSVRLIVLVGQLLPVSITTDGALMVPTISRAAQDDYRQDVWLYGGLNQVASVSVNYTLGDSVETQSISIGKTSVAKLYSTLITKSIYKDRPDVMVSFQAEGVDYERVNLEPLEIFIKIESGLESVTGSCMSDDYEGSVCIGTVTIPDAWFEYVEEDGEQVISEAVVMFGTSLEEDALVNIGNVTIETRIQCTENVDSSEIRVSVPSSIHYTGETISVSLEGNAVYNVHNFLLVCEIENQQDIQFVRIESDGNYILSSTEDDNGISISGYNTNPGSLTEQSTSLVKFGSIVFKVNEPAAMTEVNLQCEVKYLVNVRREQVLTDATANHVSLRNTSICSDTSLDILISPLDVEVIYSYTTHSSILNTYPLDKKELTYDIQTIGVYSTGEVFDYQSHSLTCNSSDMSVVKVTDCEGLVFDQDTSASDDRAIITIETASLVTTTVNVRVWYPEQPPDIIVDILELHKINEAKSSDGSDCVDVYEEATVEVQVTFTAGTHTAIAFVTEYVLSSIVSDDSSILMIINDNGVVKAKGKKGGSTNIRIQNSNASPVAVVVSDDSLTIDDISFNIHTSLDPVAFVIPSTGPPYTSTASVKITKDLDRVNTKAYVVSDAVLDNGRNYRLTNSIGLDLISEQESVIVVTPDSSEITVKGSGDGLYLRGNWSNPASCGGQLLYSTRELINVDILTIKSIEVTVGVTKLATQEFADALSLPHSTTIIVNLVYEDDSVSSVTTDDRTTYTSTDNIVSYENEEIIAVNKLLDDSIVSTTLTVTYSSVQEVFTSTVTFDIVSITNLTLEAYPHPDYSGATSIITLSRIGESDVYQQARMKVTAILNNDEETDITESPALSYNVAMGNVTKFTNNILTPTQPDAFIIEASIGQCSYCTVDTNVEGLDQQVAIVAVQDFSAEFGTTFSGELNAISNIASLGLLLEDNRQLPNIMDSNGPSITDIIEFQSYQTDIISIDEVTGVMKLLHNSYKPVIITAYLKNDSTIDSIINVDANLEAKLGDVDFGRETGSVISTDLQLNEEFTIPIYVNVNETNLGMLEITVMYEASVLSLVSRPTPGQDISNVLFESSYTDTTGIVTIGVVFRESFTGSYRTHVADLTFAVTSVDDAGYILVDVINVNTEMSTLDTIGDQVPRRSIAGRLDFNFGLDVALPSSLVALPSGPINRCASPPCTMAECGGEVTVGDANMDCVFDALDALATLQQTSNISILTEQQQTAMDADRNERIDPFDSDILLKARLNHFPLISNVYILGIDGVGSECHLTINVSLQWSDRRSVTDNETYALFAIFHEDQTFQQEFDSNDFTVGTKLANIVNPNNAYGGWIKSENLGNGVFSVQSKLGNISAADIGFVFIYGDIRNQERNVVVIGNPAPPLSYSSLDIMLPVTEE